MQLPASDAIALRAVIEHDLAQVQRLEQRLGALLQTDAPRQDPDAIAIAYYLHNPYEALENSFDQISRTFENHVKDPGRWHQEPLDKMFLDL
jgi:hypothetical protein